VSSDNLFFTNRDNGLAPPQTSHKNSINIGGSDPNTQSFTSRNSIVPSVPSGVAPGPNLGTDLSGNIGLLLNLLQTNRTNLLSTLLSSKCLASAITAGSSNITKEGNLIIGTNCDDVIYGPDGGAITYTLGGNDVVYGGRGNDIIYGGNGDDRLYGGKGNDIIVGKGGDNLLDGGPGNDILIGGAGNNLEVGGSGNDALIAGAGTTIMVGGIGSDSFDCGIVGTSIVLDYNPSEGDIISGQCKIMNNVGNNEPTPLPPS
jgi:Ca2+-binding RTX toxin-like protein